MRINRYRFDGYGKISFSSKLSNDTNYWIESHKKEEPTTYLFDYPNPKRPCDYIPLLA